MKVIFISDNCKTSIACINHIYFLLTGQNDVFLARFENNDRFGEMTNENGGRDQLDWRTTNGKIKPAVGPMKDASEDSSRG